MTSKQIFLLLFIVIQFINSAIGQRNTRNICKEFVITFDDDVTSGNYKAIHAVQLHTPTTDRSRIQLKAGYEIVFEEGFVTADNGSLQASIEPCSASNETTFYAENRPNACGVVDIKVRNFKEIEGFSHVLTYEGLRLSDEEAIQVGEGLVGLSVRTIPDTDLIYAIWTTPFISSTVIDGTTIYTLQFDPLPTDGYRYIEQLEENDPAFPPLASNELVVEGKSAAYQFLATVVPIDENTSNPNCSNSNSNLLEHRTSSVIHLTCAPNPAVGQTTIHYHLPQSSAIELALYSMLGNRVATLESGTLDAGSHTLNINTGTYPTGTYLLVLRTDHGQIVERVAIVKE